MNYRLAAPLQAGLAAALLVATLSACSATKTAEAVVTGPQEPTAAESTVTIVISRNDKVMIGDAVLSMDDLTNRLVVERTREPDLSVVIRPHEASSNLVLVQAMDVVRRAGARDVVIKNLIDDSPERQSRP